MPKDRLKAAFESGIPGCRWILRFDATGIPEAGSSADLNAIDSPRQGYVWLHLDGMDRRIAHVFDRIGSLTPEAREVLGGEASRQFVEHAERVVWGALVDHQYGVEGPKEDADFLRFAFGPGFLVTSRHAPIHSTRAARDALEKGAKVKSPIALFELMVANLCRRFAEMTGELAAAIDLIEDRVVIEGRGRDQSAGLGRARRSVVTLTRQVTGLQSTLKRLEEAGDSVQNEEFMGMAARLEQRADALARDVAILQERARTLQEEINAILTLETNDRLYVLTVITAVLMPATLVTGYFGMNTKHLPFEETDGGTFFATLICVIASLGALAILWRLGLATPKAKPVSKDSP